MHTAWHTASCVIACNNMCSYKFLWIFFLFHSVLFTRSHENFNAMKSVRLKEDGEKQYELIVQKMQIPKFGECWKKAVRNLEEGCNSLSEHKQSQLALSFTDCFLEMSGEEKNNCDIIVQLVERQKCIKHMSDRAFNVYSEFYTHTQNICFFLKSGEWQENAEETIERLTSTSQNMWRQLQEVQGSHEAMLEKQTESLSLQQDLVQNGLTLGQILQESRISVAALMQELRVSTAEQQGALGELSSRLAALQAWAIGEVSWIESLIFYVLGVAVAYMMTSVPRSHNARVWLFLLLSLGVAIEQLLHRFIVANNSDHNFALIYIKEDLYYWIWRARALNVVACIGIYLYFVCSYTDYTRVNHELLTTIHKEITRIAHELHDVSGESAVEEVGATVRDMDNRGAETPHRENNVRVALLRRRIHQLSGKEAASPLASVSPYTKGSGSIEHQDTPSIATVHIKQTGGGRRGRPPLSSTLTLLTIEQDSPQASPLSYNLRSRTSSSPRSPRL